MGTLHRDKKSGALLIDGVRIATLARKYGTPLYVYSHNRLVTNYRTICDGFRDINPLIAYSMKANSNGAVLHSLIQAGSGLDIVSAGELTRGTRAGVDPQKVIFAGVGKSSIEIAAALEAGIRAFNVESEPEADRIAKIAGKLKKTAPIALRINPDVDPETHRYISTGKKDTKFGIPHQKMRALVQKLSRVRRLRLVGIHCHIGSQISRTGGYLAALERVTGLIDMIRKDGHELELLNMGGGFGISYVDKESAMDMAELGRVLGPGLKALDLQIVFEPGRYIVGPAGFLITRVEYVKRGATKEFAIVDGAMNDLARPSLYDAHHRISLDGKSRGGRKREYDVVGPVCESGDFLGKSRRFGPLHENDLLVVCDAGAYGMVMASNYNSRPRAAEVMVKGRNHAVVRERETMDDVIGNEFIPDFIG
jgi:diaminopimelate decarboxylase